MATLQELQDAHEEILERLGGMVALFASINGDEDAATLEEMMICVYRGRECFLSAVAKIDYLIEQKREV